MHGLDLGADDYLTKPFYDPGAMIDTPQEFPTMPMIGNYPSEGQEMYAWLLARYVILATLDQVRLYEDLLGKTGGWTAKGASFVPSGTDDLMGLGRQQIEFGFNTGPKRDAVERAAQAIMKDFDALQGVLADLYDYHSVTRGWEADRGAHGKQLTKQLEGIARRFQPAFDQFSKSVERELMMYLSNREDQFASNTFLQLSTRAMISQSALIDEVARDPRSVKSNAALSKFDGALGALEKHIRANRAAFAEQYQIMMGIHDRFLGSLKDTRKQAAEMRAEAGLGEDTSGDAGFLLMQLHMTFYVYNQLQRQRTREAILMTENVLFAPSCAECGKHSARLELVPPGSNPIEWDAWTDQFRRAYSEYHDPEMWRFIYSGIEAGNGLGSDISADRAGALAAAVEGPDLDGLAKEGIIDLVGFCRGCVLPYCYDHWNVSGSGYGTCPRGHGTSLDPHWSPD